MALVVSSSGQGFVALVLGSSSQAFVALGSSGQGLCP